MFNYLIVGCGLSGVTCARLLAEKGKKVLIVEKRNHIAGNAYDFYNNDGILVHKYGPHIFHTRFKEVWDFLSRFTQWRLYQHRVLTYIDGKLVPMPINIDTINILYGTGYNSLTIHDFYDKVKRKDINIQNARDMVISKVGEELYEKFFKGYTKKQWDLYPEELDKEVTARIPIRYNRDDRYFSDKYQGIPLYGYTEMIKNMLDHENISVLLQTDYKDIQDEIKYDRMIYTGPIDYFFDFVFGKLPYRSLRFEEETLNMEYYQKVATINYPNDYDFTRITEFKHLTGQKSNKTTIMKEYAKSEGEPYYPIPTQENKELYDLYKREAKILDGVYFIGRLGKYKYTNMDVVVKEAMELIDEIE
ncbi:UDP-galactopyranose mutase [Paramaledivibacter caminithermalis]|jgi:UDP-galactopyranose mutase|uniref:UDP-galactopyranose mutase n=1 Tax=Paramaledivibacter caminithermalis (strain DSM 15212 / CIP 107654 / DViRD3) TaxID=1121301 RepID=A0A1M6L6N3_PARC5|nr:UDP-galactopyranose mutase [Paramaledivibacter caminithermalis]SHJ66865.1 UDP-galactopyranose mutase [Paramaledivibacter caminithermalis DSM 15212]